MIDGLLTLIFIVGFLIAMMFIIGGIQNVRDNIAKNRRINSEMNDQKRWERFSNYEENK